MGQCCSASLIIHKTNIFSSDVRRTFELLNSLMENDFDININVAAVAVRVLLIGILGFVFIFGGSLESP